MIIDLRSDTITKPTPPMLEAMFQAEVGDDVWGDDPSVNALESKAAQMFGMEAALFCTSGTMSNQIGIKAITKPNEEIICDKLAHIYNYEGGGLASNSLLSVRLIEGERGKITPQQIEQNINPDDIHFPITSIVALENTINKAGGNYYTLSEIEAIYQICQQNQLKLHLDGARFFNALIATQTKAAQYGKYFDTISVCLSKGLGCPVGSLLLGSEDTIRKAKRIRKVMGGGWRQAGYLAAAGIYALDHHVERLAEDHQNAKAMAQMIEKCHFVKTILPVETNIVIFEVNAHLESAEVVNMLSQKDIKVSAFGKKHIRLVTHIQITPEHLGLFETKIKTFI